jgi:3-hydroxyacyl-CoA dehydrogenase
MKLGCGHPMGPLTLGDFVGLDTTFYIANIMFDEFKEKRFAPPPLLKRMAWPDCSGERAAAAFTTTATRTIPSQLTCSSFMSLSRVFASLRLCVFALNRL